MGGPAVLGVLRDRRARARDTGAPAQRGVRRVLSRRFAAATRDAAHIARLFATRLDDVDAGFGIELARLCAVWAEPLAPGQAGLGAWGAASAVAAWQLVQAVRTLDHPTVHAIVHQRLVFELLRFLAGYAHVTYTIFLAVAVYRLLGFDLPSGFRRPFLSQSFGEFFRSFNHYVRDAVLSLLYFPMLGHLRHHARPRLAAIGAAYTSIVIGSFLLHDLLVPLAISVEPVATFAFYLDPVRIVSLLALWTLIIVPNAGIAPRRRPPRPLIRVVLSVIVVNVLYFAIWLAQREGRGWFHAP